MRPLRLRVHAIGPYPGDESIDFAQLAEDGLFLIHGPTGAGKTFLLDAITFALFGQVPGDRSVSTLRSQLAAPDAEPRVELEFTAQGSVWLIERVPQHERAKRRGSGSTEKPGRAHMSRLIDGRWQPAASGIREVDAKVRQLVGLSVRQFSQVMLLPQGRFEEVLRASSEDRERLLTTLFDTRLYEDVAEHLDRRARAEREALAAVDDQLAELRSRAADRWSEVFDDSEAPNASSGPVDRPAEGGEWAERALIVPADQEGIDDLVAAVKRRRDEAQDVASRATRRAQIAARAHDDREQLALRWARREQLVAQLDTLAESSPRIEQIDADLRLATAAESIRADLAAAAGAQADLEDSVRSLRRASAEATVARRRCRTVLPAVVADLDLDEADMAQVATARDAVVSALGELRSLGHTAEQADRLTAQADGSATESASHATAAERLRQTLDRHDEELHQSESRLAAAQLASAREPSLRQAAADARSRADAAAAVNEQRSIVTDHTREHVRLDRAVQDLRSLLNDQREEYLAGIAAELAGQLDEDHDCPVCGSREHPAPAEPSPSAVSRQQIQDTENRLESARQAERLAADALGSARTRLSDLLTVAGSDQPDVGALELEAALAEEQLRSNNENRDIPADLEARIAQIRTLSIDLASRIDGERQAATAAATRSQSLHAEAARLREQLLAVLGDGVLLADAVRALGRLADRLGELVQAHNAVATARGQLGSALLRRDAAVADSPFDDPGSAEDALLPPSEHARLTDIVRQHTDELSSTQAMLGAPELSDLPGERPDTEATLTRLTVATELVTATTKHHALLDAAHAAMSGCAEEHRRLAAATAGQIKRAELLSEMADHCMGRRGDRVSLQRWVLSSYLSDICELANRRLHSMSSGRYALRVGRGAARAGTKSGLDLVVHDSFSGEERPVHSLSGGETFQASLALALAVAESVQAHAGGVQLDTLFIDEGFGSLDSDALELAIDELDRLRAGGRMVGLISHVGALRERVRIGIQVDRGSDGSTLRVGELNR